jgi:hypothetical protein
MIAPLEINLIVRRSLEDIERGDLLTVELPDGQRSGARFLYWDGNLAVVALVGLEAPAPHKIGDCFALSHSAIIDW